MRLAVLAASLGVTLLAFLYIRQNAESRKREGPGGQPTRTSLVPAARDAAAAASTNSEPATSVAAGILERQRSVILSSPYGTAPIKDVIRALKETSGGPDIQLLFQVLALRKQEALPLVKEGLQSGEMWEKHMLTKFLRICPWPETEPELLALAGAKGEEWLPRQGALYALGALGDVSVGPQVAAILREEGCPQGVELVAIGTLARIGYRDGAEAIRPFLEDPDMHLRLFASRALAELGQPVNREFLFSALQNGDYLIRQEACEALGAAGGADITEKLQMMATNDVHEAVRDAASQSLLQSQIRDLAPAEKLAMLRGSLEGAERHNASWILQTILAQCGAEGRAFVGTLAAQDSHVGERSLAFLLLSSNTLK